MIMKRVMSKVIDKIIFGLIVITIAFLIVSVLDSVTQIDAFDQLLVISNEVVAAGDDTEMIQGIIEDNARFLLDFTYIYAMFIFTITILVGFIYFGLIGRSFKGSIGKKIAKLRVVTTDEQTPSVFVLFIREPLIQIAIISLACTIVSLLLPLFIIIPSVLNLIYVVLFFMEKDFWNKKLNVSVVSEIELLESNKEINNVEVKPTISEVDEQNNENIQ